MENKEICPCCRKHCTFDALQCGRGRSYMERGENNQDMEIREEKGRSYPMWKREGLSEEEHLMALLQGCGHLLWHRGEGKGGQRRVLAILADNAKTQMTQKDLMDRLDIRAGSASEILGKMEADGKIRRSKNGQDRRNVDVELTEEGRKALAEMGEKHEERLQQMFEGLTVEEKSKLAELLEKLLTDWEEKMRPDEKERRRRHGERGEHGPHRGCGMEEHEEHGPHRGR